MTEWQLRDYEIAEGHLGDFVAAWTAGVLPLRRAAGFHVESWTVPGESRFVWLLSYDGPGTFAAADEAYYETPARAALEPDPAQWIVADRKVILEPVTTGAGAARLRP
jgi:hypothetical protein